MLIKSSIGQRKVLNESEENQMIPMTSEIWSKISAESLENFLRRLKTEVKDRVESEASDVETDPRNGSYYDAVEVEVELDINSPEDFEEDFVVFFGKFKAYVDVDEDSGSYDTPGYSELRIHKIEVEEAMIPVDSYDGYFEYDLCDIVDKYFNPKKSKVAEVESPTMLSDILTKR